MIKLTKAQQQALLKVHQRDPEGKTFLQRRRSVQVGPGCVMVPWCGMWLGIEPDGYTHS